METNETVGNDEHTGTDLAVGLPGGQRGVFQFALHWHHSRFSWFEQSKNDHWSDTVSLEKQSTNLWYYIWLLVDESDQSENIGPFQTLTTDMVTSHAIGLVFQTSMGTPVRQRWPLEKEFLHQMVWTWIVCRLFCHHRFSLSLYDATSTAWPWPLLSRSRVQCDWPKMSYFPQRSHPLCLLWTTIVSSAFGIFESLNLFLSSHLESADRARLAAMMIMVSCCRQPIQCLVADHLELLFMESIHFNLRWW